MYSFYFVYPTLNTSQFFIYLVKFGLIIIYSGLVWRKMEFPSQLLCILPIQNFIQISNVIWETKRGDGQIKNI